MTCNRHRQNSSAVLQDVLLDPAYLHRPIISNLDQPVGVQRGSLDDDILSYLQPEVRRCHLLPDLIVVEGDFKLVVASGTQLDHLRLYLAQVFLAELPLLFATYFARIHAENLLRAR